MGEDEKLPCLEVRILPEAKEVSFLSGVSQLATHYKVYKEMRTYDIAKALRYYADSIEGV